MFQPTLSPDTLRTLAQAHLIGKIARAYDPDRRHASDPDAQADALAELAADVAEELPKRATPEAVSGILERAWKALRKAYNYQTRPKTPTVLHHVREAVQGWQSDQPQTTTYRPQRPTIPQPQVCQAKADHFRKLGAELLADYWTKLGADSAIAWTAWNGRAQ